MSTDAITEAGGYLPYWNNALKMRSSIARMAIDYVSAPGILFSYDKSLANIPISNIC